MKIKSLSQLQPGDAVMLNPPGYQPRRRATVEAVTERRIIVEGNAYDRFSGASAVDHNPYSLSVPDPTTKGSMKNRVEKKGTNKTNEL